jgi:ketosteroid isomerase-like protein
MAVREFYEAFAAGDAETMAAQYADDVHFRDPAFGDLHGEDARDMWRMLVTNARDLTVELLSESEDGDVGRARWRATYTFSQTGRPVVNDVTAAIRLRDGRIVDHVDTFDFHRWSRQALGPVGLLLGWTPFLRNKVNRTALVGLRRYQRERAGS